MAITELTRGCPLCYALLPDPAATVCSRCGRAMAPLESTWPAWLKWWLLSELQVDSIASYVTRQMALEHKLQTAMLGTAFRKPNPWSLPISTSTPIGELYPLALERAGWWRAAASPIAVRVLALPERKSA